MLISDLGQRFGHSSLTSSWANHHVELRAESAGGGQLWERVGAAEEELARFLGVMWVPFGCLLKVRVVGTHDDGPVGLLIGDLQSTISEVSGEQAIEQER